MKLVSPVVYQFFFYEILFKNVQNERFVLHGRLFRGRADTSLA